MVRFYLDNRHRYSYTPVNGYSSVRMCGTNHDFNYRMNHVDAHRLLYSGMADADWNMDNSIYSDDADYYLYGRANASASVGRGGMQANVGTSGSILTHNLGASDIHFGQGNAYAGASLGVTGMHVGAGAMLNALSFEHENVQACLGLDVSTGIGISTTDINVAVVGIGFNAGLNGFGVSTPFGRIKLKFW